MTKQRAYWAVHLGGSAPDLENWAHELPRPFDPWLEIDQRDNEQYYLLRSLAFDSLHSAQEVREQAKVILPSLNGIVRLQAGSDPVRLLGVWEYMNDRTRNITMFAEAGILLQDVRARNIEPSTTEPTRSQKWLQIALSNPVIGEMLGYFGTPLSWYELYKAFECITRYCHGISNLRQRSWAPSNTDLNRFTQTANFYYRHARNPTLQPPENPMELAEAVGMLRAMIHSVLIEQP